MDPGLRKYFSLRNKIVVDISAKMCYNPAKELTKGQTEAILKEFITIPRSLILDRDLGDKRVIVYSSILFSDWTGNSIEDLVRYSKYSACRDKSGVLNQYKTIVDHLVSKDYFFYNGRGIVYIKPNDSFGIIYYSEFQRILQERERSQGKGQRMNHAHLLLLLAHIRLNMIHRPGVPEMYSNLLVRISESTGLSVRSISAGLKILEELNIIHNEELPRYKDEEGHWHSNVRIFVNMEPGGSSDVQRDWQGEVYRGITYILASQRF